MGDFKTTLCTKKGVLGNRVVLKEQDWWKIVMLISCMRKIDLRSREI